MRPGRHAGSVPKLVPWADEHEWNDVHGMVFAADVEVQKRGLAR